MCSDLLRPCLQPLLRCVLRLERVSRRSFMLVSSARDRDDVISNEGQARLIETKRRNGGMTGRTAGANTRRSQIRESSDRATPTTVNERGASTQGEKERVSQLSVSSDREARCSFSMALDRGAGGQTQWHSHWTAHRTAAAASTMPLRGSQTQRGAALPPPPRCCCAPCFLLLHGERDRRRRRVAADPRDRSIDRSIDRASSSEA
jgi:hypothetical protein